jgi:hypothetical protein
MTKNEEHDRDEPERELDDLEVDEEAAEAIRGGVRGEPPPAGPVPIPYPN